MEPKHELKQLGVAAAWLLALLTVASQGMADQSGDYQLGPVVVGASGATLASQSYQIQNCIGQAFSGAISGANHSIQTGFLNEGIAAVQPPETATPTPTETIQVPERFFKIFHSQINPNYGERAVIRWTQPQAGPVTIRIFNLLGNKVATLCDHENHQSGQYQEAYWQGRTLNNQVAGSGIYIVLLETPGMCLRAKIAVVK